MRPFARLVLTVVVVAAGPILSACSSFDLDDYAFWDSKKKLPGDRKPVFPEGVPGVPTGVPPELVRGYREPEQPAPDPAKAAAEAAAAEQAPKPKSKPAPQRVVSKPPPKPQAPPPDPYAAAPARTAAPVAAPTPAAAQAQQPAPQAGGAPWPSAQPQVAWPGAPGTVTR